MFEQFSRSLPLFGRKGMEKLFSARVLLVGLGGVAATPWKPSPARASERSIS